MNRYSRWVFILFLALAFPPLAQSQSLSVEETLQRLYKPYTENSDPPPFDATGASAIASSRLLAALKTDSELTSPGDTGALDWDPRCGCQDFDHLAVEDIAVLYQTDNSAVAQVSVRPIGGSDAVSSLKYRFVNEHGRWLVDDITEDGKSIWQILNDSNQAQLKQLAALQHPQAVAFVRAVYTSREFDALSWPLLLTPSSRKVMEDFHTLTNQMSAKEQESKTIPDIWETSPLCGCMNPNTVKLETVQALEEVAGKTRVQVHFEQSDGTQDSREIVVRQTNGTWQIDDILAPVEGSVIQQLERAIQKGLRASK